MFDAIDNDDRWATYFHALYAKDMTRDVDQASAKDALAFLHEEEDLAVADGLGNLVTRYGVDLPDLLSPSTNGFTLRVKQPRSMPTPASTGPASQVAMRHVPQ